MMPKKLKKFLASLKIPCSISGRLKNYVAFLEKVRTFIYDGLDPYSINDELGFRIVIGTSRYDDEKSIAQLYEVANKVIAFFVIRKGYQLIKPSPANGLGFNKELFPNVFVPQKGLIYPEYAKYVKDYFVAPKKNGYQALHMVFVTKSGLTIEVQLRTFASHFHAEYVATHLSHKDERYGADTSKELTPEEKEADSRRQTAIKVTFDPEKVKLDSYFSKNGETLDLIGLQETIRDPQEINFFLCRGALFYLFFPVNGAYIHCRKNNSYGFPPLRLLICFIFLLLLSFASISSIAFLFEFTS